MEDREAAAALIPEGTVTFLLTDVEGPTRLWELAPEAATQALKQSGEVVSDAIAAHGGVRLEEHSHDNAIAAVFGSAADAVAAAFAVQQALAVETWPEGLPVRVRIGLHTGEVHVHEGRYRAGAALHRCARLRDVAHGGQIVVSAVTADIVADALLPGRYAVDLGHHRLRDLSRPERVFELRHDELAGEFPELRSLDVLPNNLPLQLTSFVGRRDELDELQRLLGEQRLVTLTGSGGCGKTRLAVQAAAAVADNWPDGVWWIDLGPVTDPALVAELTASTLRVFVEPTAGPLRALRSQLRDRRLLLCLDNCEHLLDASAELVDTLLAACPDVTVLATSREPLGVVGETVWRVPSLVEDEAVQLFADRAALVRRDFAVDAENHAAVRTICRRLDGIPLAVQLAAAWARALSPAQIAAGLDDRFRLLAGGPRVAIARQQTLAASMDWSYNLLDESDRVILRRLAVFVGSFTLDAAQAVCVADPVDGSDVLLALGRLVDKSLVDVDAGDGEARYRILETVRQYASQRLDTEGEAVATRDRYLDYFLWFAEAAEPELERDQDHWRGVLETEHDNLRAALQWGLSAPDPDRGRRLAASLARIWFLHGHAQQGLGFLHRAVEAAPDDRSSLQASLLSGTALVALAAAQPDVATAAADRGLAIATANNDDRNRGRCLALKAFGTFYYDFGATTKRAQEAQRYAEAAGDSVAADLGMLMEACMLTNRDRHAESVALARRLYERCMPRGERFCAAIARGGNEVYAALLTGDVRRAEALSEEGVRIAEPLGDYLTLGHAIANLAWVKGIAGKIDEGRELMLPLTRTIEDAGPQVQLPALELTLGKLHLWGGDFEGAVTWLEKANSLFGRTDHWIASRALPRLADALRRLGSFDEARACVDRGLDICTRMDVPRGLAECLEQSAFLVSPEDHDRGEDLHHDALAVRVEHGLRTVYVDSIDALAGLAAEVESHAEAIRLLAASDAAREVMGYPRPAINQPAYESTVAYLGTAVGDDGFGDLWAEGAALSLDDAVAYARRARGTRGRPSSGWASLTPTEVDVVRLTVEGLTNPEIGARLFISRATVKTHLSHVYSKLGIANRTELAAAATQRGSP